MILSSEVVFGLLIATSALAQPSDPQPPPLAGVVVQFGDGTVRTACVDLGGPERTGIELLRRSGLDPVTEATVLGEQVCRIGREGCEYPAQSCWCRCRYLGVGDCVYWSYNTLVDGRWSYAMLGPSSRLVRPGDVDGWAWGRGTVLVGAQPPVRTFEEICADALAPSNQTPVPTPGAATSPPAGSTATATPASVRRTATATSFLAPVSTRTAATAAGAPARPSSTAAVRGVPPQATETRASAAVAPARPTDGDTTAGRGGDGRGSAPADPGRAEAATRAPPRDRFAPQDGAAMASRGGVGTSGGAEDATDRGARVRGIAGYIVFALVAALLAGALVWQRR